MASHPDERPIRMANIFAPLAATPAPRVEAAEEEQAHEAIHRMEDTVSTILRGLEARLGEAQREIERLRLENDAYQGKLAAIEDLKRAISRL